MMKNFFGIALLVGLLGVTGCASDSARSTDANRPVESADWQYRTFPVSSMSGADFRSKVNILTMQGWTYVSVSSTTRSAQGALSMVVMKRPAR